MPTIRRLCTALEAPAAPPHVFAGVSSILTLPAPIQSETVTGGEPKRDKIPAMIIAVYFLVRTRLSGIGTSPSEYSRVGSAALAILDSIDAGKAQRGDVNGSDVDEWLREIRDRGWTTLDWFENIGEATGLESDGVRVANGASEDELNSKQEKAPMKQSLISLDRSKKNTLQAGLGTMVGVLKLSCVVVSGLFVQQMQDKVDYLSEERRLGYVTWKQDILARIERREGEQHMDVSAR